MPSLEELQRTIDARMQEILRDTRTLQRSPRSTITPDRSRADTDGRRAVELLRALGRDERGLEMRGTIGEGGMGIVRAAHQVALGREVAVKTLKDGVESEAAVLKLLREAWVTGALEHPNVVPVYDVSLGPDGSPRIVLKKIAGSDWASLMRDEATIRRTFHARDPLEWNIRILMQVCNAIHFAHARGILHRDLKPENVMIGEFGEVYVLDWGIAVSLRDDGSGRLPLARDAFEMAGTPAYMAPEMLGGMPGLLSERTDVYLLGAILYEIAVGHPPHEGESFLEIVHRVARSRPEIPDTVPGALARILRRALDRDPDARFESAEQLRLALAGFLEHRGSIALATEAERRLGELERERARTERDAEERRLRLYHVFAECRFGFLQALHIWRDNERARDGLRRAIETMIAFELEDGDPRAAAILLADLDDPPPDLVQKVQHARRARDEEDARREALARDLDPAVGRRTRVFLGAVLGAVWTIAPWLAWWYERDHGIADQALPTLWTGLMIVVAGALAIWARDSLSRTAINRRLVRATGIALFGQLALLVVTWRLGISVADTRILLLLHYAITLALTSATIEAKLWPSALAAALACGIGAAVAETSYPLTSASNFVLLINVVAIWARIEEDVMTPLEARREARRRAFRRLLERTRVRDLLPPRDPS